MGLVEALAYPLVDGGGWMLLVVFPPLLTLMSVPIFDILTLARSGPSGGFNALVLLVVPFALPLSISFLLTFGYVLLYLGRVLGNSALGRRDHPRFPLWDRHTIVEGIARWTWAAVVGVGVGGLPILLYAKARGAFDPLDWLVVAVLLALAAGYAQMGLAASILHDDLAMAHPLTIARAIARIGGDFIRPWLTTTIALLLVLGAFELVLYRSPNLAVAALGLWGVWALGLYAGMVVMHVLGWCYYRNGAALGWFRRTPSWGAWERPGRIYSNS